MASGRNATFALRSFMPVVNVILLASCLYASAEIRTAVIDKQTGQLSVLEGFRKDFVAWANFTDDIKNSG